jgi:hypothetical protein
MEGIKTIIYPVKDLAKAKAMYGGLAGVEPYADQAYYVGYKVAGRTSDSIPTVTARG